MEFNLKAVNRTSKGPFLFEDVFVEHFMGEFCDPGPQVIRPKCGSDVLFGNHFLIHADVFIVVN